MVQRSEMEIIPAVDIRGGKCVRLYQGDYNQETVFDEDPVTAALTWYSQGARYLLKAVGIMIAAVLIMGSLQNLVL